MQIENYNQPFIDALSEYDDGRDLSDYDFDQDGFDPPYDDGNKRKLAFRQRAIANKYKEVSGNRRVYIFIDFFQHWDVFYTRKIMMSRLWSFLLSCLLNYSYNLLSVSYCLELLLFDVVSMLF